MSTPDPRPMTIEEFTPYVGKVFMADCEPQPAELKMIEASPLTQHGTAGRPPFILVFYTSPEHRLMDGQYVLRCGEFGPVAIFLSDMIPPLGAEAGYYYQSVFN